MRAMVLHRQGPIGPGRLQPEDRPDPDPGPREIRVRVRAAAICRTDLHVIEGDLPPQRLPLIPGHQTVGVVDRLGPGCRRFRPGDRVGIAWLRWTDGVCDFCRTGSENLCEASRYTGYHEDGGFAELAVVPEDFAYAIPDAFTDQEAAPLLCAGIIGYRALARTETRGGGRWTPAGKDSLSATFNQPTVTAALGIGCACGSRTSMWRSTTRWASTPSR